MELLKKLIKSLAGQIKNVKESSLDANIPEAAVIRQPIKEQDEEEDEKGEGRTDDDYEKGGSRSVHFERNAKLIKRFQHVHYQRPTTFVYWILSVFSTLFYQKKRDSLSCLNKILTENDLDSFCSSKNVDLRNVGDAHKAKNATVVI